MDPDHDAAQRALNDADSAATRDAQAAMRNQQAKRYDPLTNTIKPCEVYASQCHSVELIGGPRDGAIIKVSPLTNCAVWWEVSGHWYRYNAADGKAYHMGKAPEKKP